MHSGHIDSAAEPKHTMTRAVFSFEERSGKVDVALPNLHSKHQKTLLVFRYKRSKFPTIQLLRSSNYLKSKDWYSCQLIMTPSRLLKKIPYKIQVITVINSKMYCTFLRSCFSRENPGYCDSSFFLKYIFKFTIVSTKF